MPIKNWWINGDFKLYDTTSLEPTQLTDIGLSDLEWTDHRVTFVLYASMPNEYLTKLGNKKSFSICSDEETIIRLVNCKIVKKQLGDDLLSIYPEDQSTIILFAHMEGEIYPVFEE